MSNAIIHGETLEALRNVIRPLDIERFRDNYRNGRFPRADKVKDLDTRYRWDLFWAAGGMDVLRHLPNLKSAHIDTALRAVVPPLNTDQEVAS